MAGTAETGERQFAQSRTYDLILTIKDQDYSNDLISCQVVSSVNSIYNIVKLELFLDPNDILVDITGEDPLKLSIVQLGEANPSNYDRLDFDLIYIKSGFEMPIRERSENISQKDRTSFVITCVVREAYKTMTTLVNKIYMGKTMQEIIEDLVQNNTNATLTLDTDNINTEVLDQVLIPPSTLSNSLKYLDNTFGIYKGIANYKCSNDNVVEIRNISKKLNMNQTFTIYQLAIDTDSLNIIEEASTKDNVFYTYDNILVQYSANSKMSILSKNLKHIVKPSDTLSYEIEQDLEEVSKEYGLIYSSRIPDKKIQFDPIIENRTRYYTNHTGYEKDSNFAISNITKATANIMNVSFRVERNMNLLPLVRSGESVKFNTEIQEYVRLAGKYILKSTILVFEKSRDWEAVAMIYLMRSNKDS